MISALEIGEGTYDALSRNADLKERNL